MIHLLLASLTVIILSACASTPSMIDISSAQTGDEVRQLIGSPDLLYVDNMAIVKMSWYSCIDGRSDWDDRASAAWVYLGSRHPTTHGDACVLLKGDKVLMTYQRADQ